MAQRKTDQLGSFKVVAGATPSDKRPKHPTDRKDRNKGPIQIVDNDLMLFDEEGDFYRITEEQYLKHKIPRDSHQFRLMTEQMELLINQGVVLADISEGSLEGVDCACYLVNMAEFRHVSSAPPQHKPPEKPVKPGSV